MRVKRAARLLVKKNFTGSPSKRVAAIRYVPPVVTSSLNNHSLDPMIIENLLRDIVTCEAVSFTFQLAVILISLHAKSVQRDLSIACDSGICEDESD